MSFFNRIISFIHKNDKIQVNSVEALKLQVFDNELNELLKQDRFIARSDYSPIVKSYADLFEQMKVLNTSGTLGYFCKDKGMQQKKVISFLSVYGDLLNVEGLIS